MVDNMITLYDSDETSFTTNGLGNLSEAVSCEVHEELNGLYELTLEYPISGRHYTDLKNRRIIFAKPNPFDPPQAFRIYEISTPLQGNVTVSAQHISYDLSGKPIDPFSAISLAETFEKLKTYSVTQHNFTFEADFMKTGSLSFNAPCSTRALLGDGENGVLGVFGGEYEWDNFKVKLHESRGTNRGVCIRSGKNLLDLTHEEKDGEVPTGVYPYWYGTIQTTEDGEQIEGLVQLHSIVYANGVDNRWVVALDCSSMFQEYDGPPTEEMLREKAVEWVKENCSKDPFETNITFSFVSLSESLEYKDFAVLEEIHLGDTVSLYAEDQGIDCERKCVAYNYDVLGGRYIDLDMGDPKETIANVIVGQNITMEETAKHLLVEFKIGMDSITSMVQDLDKQVTSRIEQFAESITLRVDGIEKQAKEDLENYANTVTSQMEDLQGQIDGAIETWFYNYEPTSDNYPASEWKDDVTKHRHLKDLFYVVDDAEKGGQAYRWVLIDDVYQWQLVEDVEVAKALSAAAKAQDTADHKRRVFTVEPYPPYDVGDMWVQGPNGDLMCCIKSQSSGDFSADDWELASKYTDDTTALEVKAELKVLDDEIKGTVSSINSLSETVSTVSQKANSIEQTVSSRWDNNTISSQITQGVKNGIGNISLVTTGSLGGTASINLYSDGVYVDSDTISLSNVRQKWADDTSAVVVNGGTVTFNSNTFIVNSSNLKIESSGTAHFKHIRIYGSHASFDTSAWNGPNYEGLQMKGHIRLTVDSGDSLATYCINAGPDGTDDWQQTSLLYGSKRYGEDGTHFAACLGHVKRDTDPYWYKFPTRINGNPITTESPINDSSDRDRKKDISDLPEEYVALFDKLRPVRFHYKTDDSTFDPYKWGYIAQEMERAIYDVGLTRHDVGALVGEDGTGLMAISYSGLIPMFHLKIRQLEERIKQLEEKNHE